jgi:hypothetical protein
MVTKGKAIAQDAAASSIAPSANPLAPLRGGSPTVAVTLARP